MQLFNGKPSYLFLLIFNAFSVICYSQFTVLSMARLPFGENYKVHEKSLKSNFAISPIFMKAELNEAFILRYENVSFDGLGNAEITFRYIHNKLMSAEVELEFFSDKFYLMKTVQSQFEKTINSTYKAFQEKEVLGNIDSAIFKIQNCIEKEMNDYSQNETLYSKLWFPPGTDPAKKLTRSISAGMYLNSNSLKSCRGLISFKYSRLDLSKEEMSSRDGIYTQTEEYPKKKIPLKEANGVFNLPVKINNTITLNFILDLGAADVSISQDVFTVLLKAGSIEKNDYIGEDAYQLADGTTIKSRVINLKSLILGDVEIYNVKASVSNSSESPLLLGQSALKKIGKYQIDNTKLLLTIDD